MQRHNVLLKVQGSVCVGVKAAEDMPSVGGRICIWEETGVDALKLFFGDASSGTLFEEAGVPCAELFLRVFGVQLQIIQNLFGQSTALTVPHIPKLYTSKRDGFAEFLLAFTHPPRLPPPFSNQNNRMALCLVLALAPLWAWLPLTTPLSAELDYVYLYLNPDRLSERLVSYVTLLLMSAALCCFAPL